MRGFQSKTREWRHPCMVLIAFDISALQIKMDIAVAIYEQLDTGHQGRAPHRDRGPRECSRVFTTVYSFFLISGTSMVSSASVSVASIRSWDVQGASLPPPGRALSAWMLKKLAHKRSSRAFSQSGCWKIANTLAFARKCKLEQPLSPAFSSPSACWHTIPLWC